MSRASELLKQFADVTPDLRPEIDPVADPASVNTPTSEEALVIAAGRNDGTGGSTDDQVALDLRELSDIQLIQKYGFAKGTDLIDAKAQGEAELYGLRNGARSTVDAATDVVGGITTGLVGGLGGLASLAISPVSDSASVAVADFTDEVTDAVDYFTASKAKMNSRRATQASFDSVKIDNDKAYERDVAEFGEFKATLRSIGREIMSSSEVLGDSTLGVEDIVSQGTGSLLVGGPVIKGVSKGGQIAVTLLQKGGVISAKGGTVASRAVATGAPVVGITALESSGAYKEALQTVMAIPHDDLIETSTDYQALIESGMDPQDAKKILAVNTAQITAALTAPIAAVAGAPVGKFAANPIASRAASKAIRNVLKETAEEAGQGANATVAQNLAFRDKIDPDQSIGEGVGRSLVEGAIGGFGAAGVISAPGAIGGTIAAAGKATANGAVSAVQNRLKSVDADIAAENPVGLENVSTEFQERAAASQQMRDDILANLQNDETATDEIAEEVTRYTGALMSNLEMNLESDRDYNALSEDTQDLVGEPASKIELVTELAKVANNEATAPEQRLEAANVVEQIVTRHSALSAPNRGDTAVDGLSPDSPVREAVTALKQTLAKTQDIPEVRQALAKIPDAVGSAVSSGALTPVDSSSIGSPEGQRSIQNTVATAQTQPTAVPEATVDTVLKQAADGIVELTNEQRSALVGAKKLITAQRRLVEEKERLGLTNQADIVTKNIVFEENESNAPQPSLNEHAKRVQNALRNDEPEAAKSALQHLANFAQHMQNKVQATNDHLAIGSNSIKDAVQYDSLQPSGSQFLPSLKGAWVSTNAVKSVKFAQQVALEAELAADVANGLIESLPELQVQPVIPTPLATELQRDASDVVRDARGRRREAAGQTEASSTAEAKSDAKTEVQQETSEPAVSRIPVERAQKASDKQLQKSLDKYLDKQAQTQLTPQDEATFAVLEAEQARRQAAAAEAEVEKVKAENDQLELELENAKDENAQLQSDLAEAEAQETQAEPEPDAAPDPEPEVEAEAPTEVAVEEEAPPFSDLIGDAEGSPVQNWFRKTFKARSEPRTLVGFASDKLGTVRDFVLGDVGTRSPAIAAAYGGLFKDGDTLKKGVADRLQSYLKEPYSKKDKTTRLEKFLNDGRLNTFNTGRVLNLTKLTENGGLEYDQDLLDMATVAAMQWYVESQNYRNLEDAESAGQLIGLSEGVEAPSVIVDTLNQGMSLATAASTLGQKIEQYWDVQRNGDVYEGMATGIPEGMAKELLSVMQDSGMIEIADPVTHVYGKEGVSEMKLKTPFVIRPVKLVTESGETSPLYSLPNVIEDQVIRDAEKVGAKFGEPHSRVASTQLRNPNGKLTKQQVSVLEREQAVPYKWQPKMASLFQGLGKDGVLKLFGAGDITNVPLNDEHRKSLEGVNLSFSSAYDTMLDLQGELEQYASANDMGVADVPTYYSYEFTKVNRLQMMGANNPQSNKLIREVLLPTQATLNLNDQGQYESFMLAVAQHLGVKVELKDVSVAIKEAQDILSSGAYAEAIDALSRWSVNDGAPLPENTVDLLQEALAGENTPAAVHSLVEYTRYLNDPEGRSEFETSLYLEADGKTNGPANAVQLFSTGKFSEQWLDNSNRSGLFPGSQDRTLNQEGSKPEGFKDLYQATSDRVQYKVAQQLQKYPVGSDLGRPLRALFSLMDLTLGGNFNFDANEDSVEVSRGLAKNPLTVTLYGSGAQGISSKLVHEMKTKIYQLNSTALQAMEKNKDLTQAEAMFGKADPDADRKFRILERALEVLGNTEAREFKGDVSINSKPAMPEQGQGHKEFRLPARAEANIRSHVQQLFVNDLRTSIEETVGSDVMNTLTLLRGATQAQSIAFAAAFKQEIEAKVASKKAELGDQWNKSLFLTTKEVQDAYNKWKDLAPSLSTGNQNLEISLRDGAELSDSAFSETLDGKFSTPGLVNGPRDIGVKGIPTVVISTGDGQMIQYFIEDGADAGAALKVFDGINMPIDKIGEYSQRANKAALSAWQQNPMRSVAKSFERFQKSIDAGILKGEAAKQVAEALYGRDKATSNMSATDVVTEVIPDILNQLNEAADAIEARQNSLARIGMSVDQMASAAAPFIQETPAGAANLTEASKEDVVTELRKLQSEELAKVKNKLRGKDGPENIAADLTAVGELIGDGLYSIGSSQLEQLATNKDLPTWHRRLMQPLVQALKDSGYKVIAGTEGAVSAYAQENQIPLGGGTANGWTVPAKKTILLTNPSSETLTHELIHAATFNSVAAYYSSTTEGLGDKQRLAVKRLETLMEQFLELDVSKEKAATKVAYLRASEVVTDLLADGRPAEALNEFMAWGLSNQELAGLQSRTKASALATLARSVIDGIKKLLWGGRKFSPVMDDMLSNVRFNAEVLMQQDINLAEAFTETTLQQSSNPVEDANLLELNQTLAKQLFQHMEAKAVTANLENAASPTAVKEAVQREAALGVEDALFKSSETLRILQSGFQMSPEAQRTYQLIGAVFSVGGLLDPNMMVRVEEMYSHVVENMKVEDFQQNPGQDDNADYAQANRKYQALLDSYQISGTIDGRSSSLPNFLALALTNTEFRDMLSNMSLPDNLDAPDGTVDTFLLNLGTAGMNRLGNMVSDGGPRSANMVAGIDAIRDAMIRTMAQRKNAVEQGIEATGGLIDRANDKIVELKAKGAQKTFAEAGRIAEATDNRAVEVAAKTAKAVAGLIDRDIGRQAADDALFSLDRKETGSLVRRFYNDVIGRTDSIGTLFDRIKPIRGMVQQLREQYKTKVPKIIANQFSRELTVDEKAALHVGLGKTDVAALVGTYTSAQVVEMLGDTRKAQAAIAELEGEVQTIERSNGTKVIDKAKQLANYMVTGVQGPNLLRNAEAVSALLGVDGVSTEYQPKAGLVPKVDNLVSLYAMEALDPVTRERLQDLIDSEKEGLEFSLDYMGKSWREEREKIAQYPTAKFNYYKGSFPDDFDGEANILVAYDADHDRLVKQGFQRMGGYKGSNLNAADRSMSYYYTPVAHRASYEQGVIQNTQQTGFGVNLLSGTTMGRSSAGQILDGRIVSHLWKNRHKEVAGRENLMPVFDATGHIASYERSMDPTQLEQLKPERDFAQTLAVWRGRQIEEEQAIHANNGTISALHQMYQKSVAENPKNKDSFINLMSEEEQEKNPVLKDSMQLMPAYVRRSIESQFGNGEFWVRKSLVDDVVGYRSASVRNVWDGGTRQSRELLKVVEQASTAVFGRKAYSRLVQAEDVVQGFVGDAKTTIVVRSVIVPMANLAANILQMWSRGIPVLDIGRGLPKKANEVDRYLETREEKIEVQAKLRAVGKDVLLEKKLRNRLRVIDDMHRSLSIWPLIEAGEFTSISEDIEKTTGGTLVRGKLSEYVEEKVNELPDGLKTAARYGIITRDTALYKGLQRSVEYGDFLAKALLFDHLTKKKGDSAKEALIKVGEEYVNYDRLPGRGRGYMESIGAIWFWNFKLRSIKVAASIIQENPLHALIASFAPAPDFIGDIGSPVTDNWLSVLWDDRMGYSVGPGMGLRSYALNPWVNLVS